MPTTPPDPATSGSAPVTGTASLPFLSSSGTARDVGRAHGAAFAGLIQASVASCHQRIEQVLDLRLADAYRFVEAQRAQLDVLDAGIVAEMDGIAEGAGVDPLDVVLLHVRTALSRMVESARTSASLECTTIAVGPQRTASGAVLAAQNWDMHPSYAPRAVVIQQRIDGEPGLLFVAEAGMVFSHGMNSRGVAILANALYAAAAGAPDKGVPVQITRRIAMRQATADDAAAVIASLDRAHAVNHLIADTNGTLADIEAFPGGAHRVEADAGVLVHTNHAVGDAARASTDVLPIDDRPDSVRRFDRAHALLADRHDPIDVATLRKVLSDHGFEPDTICRHPQAEEDPNRTSTVSSTVFDLTARRMWNTPGPPCTGTATEFRLDESPLPS